MVNPWGEAAEDAPASPRASSSSSHPCSLLAVPRQGDGSVWHLQLEMKWWPQGLILICSSEGHLQGRGRAVLLAEGEQSCSAADKLLEQDFCC